MTNRDEIERRREAFKQVVKSKGFNVPKLAAAANIPRSTLYSYWRAETDHMLGVTESKVCEVLGVAREGLFGLQDGTAVPATPTEKSDEDTDEALQQVGEIFRLFMRLKGAKKRRNRFEMIKVLLEEDEDIIPESQRRSSSQ